jgi:hypothetical protein
MIVTHSLIFVLYLKCSFLDSRCYNIRNWFQNDIDIDIEYAYNQTCTSKQHSIAYHL